MEEKDKFTQLVDDLVEGKLTLTHIRNAIRASIRYRKDIPDGVKDLLCGSSETYSGLISKMFITIEEVIGTIELAFRRGSDK